MINVCDHGAIPGSEAIQTAAIQSALDACAQAGGGTVVVPTGRYRIGTLRLASHVTLHLENGACLKGSSSIADYPEVAGGFTDAVGQQRNRCLIYAHHATGPAITGFGLIDGNGPAFGHDQDGRPS